MVHWIKENDEEKKKKKLNLFLNIIFLSLKYLFIFRNFENYDFFFKKNVHHLSFYFEFNSLKFSQKKLRKW